MHIARPNMLRHIDTWDDKRNVWPATMRLAAGAVLVLDTDLIHQVLTNTDNYREQSAFLRTRSHDPLPGQIRSDAIRGLISVIGAFDLDFGSAPRHIFPGTRSLRTQQWGVRYLRHVYAGALASDRSDALNRALDAFLEEKIIRDDTAGVWRRQKPARRDQLHAWVGAQLAKSHRNMEPVDLVDVVNGLGIDLPLIERGELYLRLVHSTISFQGAGLEHGLMLAYMYWDFHEALTSGRDIRPYLQETQRLFPTAWRLVRTVAKPHRLGTEQLVPGDELITATTAAHHDAANYPKPRQFSVENMSDASASRQRAFLAFGRGRGMCPGREIAYQTIESALRHIASNYEVRFSGRDPRKPYVRSILAPPAGKVRFKARMIRSGSCEPSLML